MVAYPACLAALRDLLVSRTSDRRVLFRSSLLAAQAPEDRAKFFVDYMVPWFPLPTSKPGDSNSEVADKPGEGRWL